MWSNTVVSNFITVKYSLHKPASKTIPH